MLNTLVTLTSYDLVTVYIIDCVYAIYNLLISLLTNTNYSQNNVNKCVNRARYELKML